MFRFRGPRYPPQFVSRSLRLRSRRVRGGRPGRGQCSTGDPIAGVFSRGRERDLPGFQAVHPVPLPRSRTPAESTIPRLIVGLVDAAPASQTAKASACQLFRGYLAASAPAAYASRMVLPPPLQSSLPAGWLASTGRESNPLDRFERFQITFSFPFPGLNPGATAMNSRRRIRDLPRWIGRPYPCPGFGGTGLHHNEGAGRSGSSAV